MAFFYYVLAFLVSMQVINKLVGDAWWQISPKILFCMLVGTLFCILICLACIMISETVATFTIDGIFSDMGTLVGVFIFVIFMCAAGCCN